MPNRILWVLTAVFLAAVLYTASTARSRPVLLSFEPEPDMVRPRNYCIMNPFRDRTPERVAERFLEALGKGDAAALTLVNPEAREKEMQWPLRSWRVGTRHDESGRTELMYWAERGNGYSDDGIEEEAHLTVSNSRVVAFSAIY